MGETGRRSQAQRTATSRRRLLEAAADCLVEEGLSGLTIAAVAGRAGLSTGALFHHFGDKVGLVVALAEHVSQEQEAAFLAAMPTSGSPAERAAAAVAAIAEVTGRPRYVALLELYTAARTDATLADRLAVLNRWEAVQHQALAASLFPDGAPGAGLDDAAALVIYALMGMAMAHIPEPNPAVEAAVVSLLQGLAAGVAAGADVPGEASA